jgi:hypothetical protein
MRHQLSRKGRLKDGLVATVSARALIVLMIRLVMAGSLAQEGTSPLRIRLSS